MHFHARPISFKPSRLTGLSTRLMASHYENNYGGAVRRLNAILDDRTASDPATLPGFRLNGLKREELIATNSMLLHEVFFDGLGDGGGGDPGGPLADAIESSCGSLARWRAEFVAMGKALGGGSGWVVLSRSPKDGRLSNVWLADHTHSLAGGTPLLALDMYEHAYHLDFGSNAAGYVDAFMTNISWPRVSARWSGATFQARPDMVDAPTARAMLEADSELVVIDARLATDAETVPVRLRGARRAPPERVDEIAASLPRGAKALVYCAWGFEIGSDCAATLRERGVDAIAIAGGIATWRANGLPTEPLTEGDT